MRKDNGIRRGPFGSALKKDLFVSNSDYVVYEQQNAIYDRFNTRYNISEEKFNELSNFEIIPGDFIMSGAGTIGRIAMVPENIKRGVFNQALIRFKLDFTKSDSVFFLQLMRSEKMQRKLTSSNPGSAMMNLVPMSELKKWKIYIPSVSEQIKIGELLSGIDNAVALHQRKLENLRSLKSIYLYYMFPSGTEKVPKLRFSNFKNEWDLRTLNDISEKIIEKNTKNIYKETLTNSAEYGIINQREFFSKDISNEKNLDGYYVVRNNDFVYNPRISNFAPVGPIKRNKLNRIGVMSPLYYVFRPSNINFDFLEYFFETTLWHKFMKVNGDSGARSDRFAIKDSVLKLMPIPFPTSSEQKEIGTFFEKIDDAITLHQQKLEQMQNLKQAFLQKMFI